MPTYSYKCSGPDCGLVTDDRASMSDFKEHTLPCPECGSVCSYVWVPSVPQVAFKDGPSGSWPSKGNRFKKFREKSSQAAERRQNERYGKPNQLVPNYKGKETGSWEEAAKQAKSDAGDVVAATYLPKIESEKK